MKVPIGQTISYVVDKTELRAVRVVLAKDGSLVFLAQYQWLDASGNGIRTGSSRYQQAELEAAFTAAGKDYSAMITAIKALIPTAGSGQSLFVAMIRDPFVFRGVWMTNDGTNNVWNNTTYTTELLTAAGLDVAVFTEATSLLATAMTVA